MTEDEIYAVRVRIKDYIEDIGDDKIKDRTLDKVLSIYKLFISDIFNKAKPLLKEHSELKVSLADLKKRKLEKGATKHDKIIFSKVLIQDLIKQCIKHQELADIEKTYAAVKVTVSQIKSWNIYEQWIDWALDFGEESYLATHIAKLTHSSSKGSSVDCRYYPGCEKFDGSYITTPKNPILDTAYPDNKYSSISQFYNIEISGRYVGDLLREGGEDYLSGLTTNEPLLNEWCERFTKLITNPNKQSYFLSKQLYFPEENGYHLLIPLTSSSLLHEIHLSHKNYFSDEQNEVRVLKEKSKYSPLYQVSFPKKAYLHVTGSNHSNASSLNGKRGGRVALLPASPPQWQSSRSSYKDKETIFDRNLNYALQESIKILSHYLLLIKNKQLSISQPQRNAAVIQKLQSISDVFFDYIEGINCNEKDEGWTIDSALPIAQQLLCEPWRDDTEAKQHTVNNQWQKTLSQDYALWLSRQLNKDKRLNLSTIHAAIWRDAFSVQLREIVATSEVTL